MRVRLLGCGLLVACGRVGFASHDAATDAGTDAGTDLSILTVPFGTPIAVPELLHAAPDYDPALSSDELEIYYSSRRSTPMPQVNRATRTSTATAWSMPAVIAELASGERDVDPALSADRLTLVFSRTRNASVDLWVATRTDAAAAFGPATRIEELVGVDEEEGPSLSDDGLTIYFHAGPMDAFDIYSSTRPSLADPWEPPQVVAELASQEVSDSDPMITGEGRVLVFSSNRRAPPDIDLWLATRESVTEPFGAPVPLSELNTTFVDSSPWLSPDLRTIYFTSERSGERAIYMATR